MKASLSLIGNKKTKPPNSKTKAEKPTEPATPPCPPTAVPTPLTPSLISPMCVESNENRREWGEESGGRDDVSLSRPSPPLAIDFSASPRRQLSVLLRSRQNRPNSPCLPNRPPPLGTKQITMTVRCGYKVQGRRGDRQRCERSLLSFIRESQSAKPSGKSSTHLFSALSLSLSLRKNPDQSTAALKVVIAECKVGAKLVDIANKGDALIEE